MRIALAFVALLASCEGHCRRDAAVAEVVPDGVCAVGHDMAICLKGEAVVMCSIDGEFTHTASCSHVGFTRSMKGQ